MIKKSIMPNQSDIKTITTFSNEQLQLFKELAVVIKDDNSNKMYYHLPFFFKDLGYNEFEVIRLEDLPEDVQELAETDEVKDLKHELKVTDELYEDIKRVLQAIPECEDHGDMCIPHALEWIEEKKNT